ncbi:hypothetical protein HDV06_001246 [Boothiomyces sp. JEL0866]|nr:hypothetical protein HDV06_001246 [Boothiomyces sp. JEL0866]
MNDAAAALIGYFITKRRGFSLAACGFVHASHFEKITFAGRLGYKSPSRKFLSRFSTIWIIQVVCAIVPIFAAASLSYQDYRYVSGTLTCETFIDSGYAIDRGYPKLDTAMGVAELLFGASIGTMRSENNVNVTTHVIAPQLVDAASDTTIIQGSGFTTSITSSCHCLTSFDSETLINEGFTSNVANQISNAAPGNQTFKPGFINNIQMSTNNVTVSTILTGTTVCSSTNDHILLYPLCTTTLYDHKNALISINFKTDGTSASIAPVNVHVLETYNPANSTLLYLSLVNILEGETSYHYLPQTISGAQNPLLWWATTNMVSVDPAIIEPGIETMISIILRSGVFRTFNSEGSACQQSVLNTDYVIIHISDLGYGFGMTFVIIEYFVLLMCLLSFIPWLAASKPIGPGVRIASDRTYFTVMVNSTAVQSLGIVPLMETDIMWNKFDIIVRVGESKQTKDDEELGKIALDLPKLVSHFTWGKSYY